MEVVHNIGLAKVSVELCQRRTLCFETLMVQEESVGCAVFPDPVSDPDGYLIDNAFSEIESQLPLVPRILVILFDQASGQVEIMPKSLDSETNRSHHAFPSLPTIPRGYYPSTSAKVGKPSMLQSSSLALSSVVVRSHCDRSLSNGSLRQEPES